MTWDGLPVSAEKPYGATVVVWRERAGAREFLLLHRRAHPVSGDWAWTPPSGARLPGEALPEAASRELREETGLDLACEVTDLGTEDWAIYVALAPPEAAVVLDDEHDRFEWLSAEDAAERCRPDAVRAGFEAAAAWIYASR